MQPPTPKVLVIDDEKAMRAVLEQRLSRLGLAVAAAEDLASAEAQLDRFSPDLAICDVMLPDGSGLDLLERLRRNRPHLPVIMITAHGSIDLAVEAMKAGADDFLTKPLDHDRLRAVVEGALALSSSRSESSDELLPGLVGRSEAMQAVCRLVKDSAQTGAPVLLTGENGTGKELVARAIHAASPRRKEPFIPINSAAIPRELMESEIFGHEKGAFTGAVDQRKGCFELADGGTLFLDEIGEMPVELQPKLLRVLEDGRIRRIGGRQELQFDVRLVSATNREVERAIAERELREDLFYRLSVFQIRLPPLREREGDIAILARHFVAAFNREYDTSVEGLSDDALALLEGYSWPGNVRELRNTVHRAVVLTGSGPIEPRSLQGLNERGRGAESPDRVEIEVGTSLAEAERRLILKTLERVGNNKSEAARQLGLDVKTVRNKLKSYEAESGAS